jgi:hypothetical protein
VSAKAVYVSALVHISITPARRARYSAGKELHWQMQPHPPGFLIVSGVRKAQVNEIMTVSPASADKRKRHLRCLASVRWDAITSTIRDQCDEPCHRHGVKDWKDPSKSWVARRLAFQLTERHKLAHLCLQSHIMDSLGCQ